MTKKNNIVLSIIMVLSLIALVYSATYAYFMWRSDQNNQTNLSFTISKSNFTISGTNISGDWLTPTSNCASQTNAIMGKATVIADNKTATTMRANIVLKGKLTPASGRTFNDEKEYIHWTIKEVNGSNDSYSIDNCAISSNTASAATGTFSSVGANYTDVNANIYFDVQPKTSTTKYYQVYVWIDNSYESWTIGNEITDVMQGLNVELVFSDDSTFEQLMS